MSHDSDSTHILLPPGRHRAPPVPGELPAVIVPRPIRLAELEAMAADRHPMLHRLAQTPAQVDFLAGIVFARDAAARLRFDDRGRLARYLQWLLATGSGPAAPAPRPGADPGPLPPVA